MTTTGAELSGGESGAECRHHLYPAMAMAGDYLRAAAGLVPSGALLLSVPLGSAPGVIIGTFAGIFGAFAIRTVLRHATRIEATRLGLRASGVSHRAIAWSQLDRLKLGYYSTRRDRRAGWMQLELGAGGTRIRLDSRIDGFDDLVRRAAGVAIERDVDLSPATISNLQALGITVSEAGTGR